VQRCTLARPGGRQNTCVVLCVRRDDTSSLFLSRTHQQQKARACRPGLFGTRTLDHAAGLNSFDALVLIGSTVSVATFCESSASSLL